MSYREFSGELDKPTGFAEFTGQLDDVKADKSASEDFAQIDYSQAATDMMGGQPSAAPSTRSVLEGAPLASRTARFSDDGFPVSQDFVNQVRSEVIGVLPLENRMPALIELARAKGAYGAAAKALLAQAREENLFVNKEDERTFERLKNAPRVPRTGGGGVQQPLRAAIPDVAPSPLFPTQQTPEETAQARAFALDMNVRRERDSYDNNIANQNNTRDRTVGEYLSDIGVRLEQGAIMARQIVANSIDPSSAWAQDLNKKAEFAEQNLTPQAKYQAQQLAGKLQEQPNEWAKFGVMLAELVTNPTFAVEEVVRQLPIMTAVIGATVVGGAGGGIVARGAMSAAPRLALADAISAGMVVATGRTVGGIVGGRAASATAAGGDAGGTVYREITSKKNEWIMEDNPDVKQLMSEGKTFEQARHEVALTKARFAQVIASMSGAIFGGAGFENLLARKIGGQVVKDSGAKALLRETGTEVIDELATQGASNYAVGQVDPSKSLTEGFGQTAATSLVTSLPFAGASALMSRGGKISEDPQADAAARNVFQAGYSFDPSLVSPTQTVRQASDVGPAPRVVNFTEPGSATDQAGLTPIVVPVPTGETDVSTTGGAGPTVAGGGQPPSDFTVPGLGDAGLGGIDATGGTGISAPGLAPLGGEAAPLGAAGGQQPAGLARPFERATDADLLARTEASIASQEGVSGVGQPQPWAGRSKTGYATEQDADQAKATASAVLDTKDTHDWRVEPMGNGKFQLVPYLKETINGNQTPQAVQATAQGQEAATELATEAGATAGADAQTLGEAGVPQKLRAVPVAGLSAPPLKLDEPTRSGLRLAPQASMSTVASINSSLNKYSDGSSLPADKQIQFNVVSTKDLTDQHRIASAVARLIGKTYTVVREDTGKTLANGYARLGGRDILVAEDSNDAPLFVAIHEGYHGLPRQRRQELNKALLELFRGDMKGDFLTEFDYTDDQFDEEAPAFMAQVISKRADFWEQLRTKMGNKEFGEVAKVIISRLSQIITGASKEYGSDFADKYITDIVKARDLLSTAYAEAMQEQGLRPDIDVMPNVSASQRSVGAMEMTGDLFKTQTDAERRSGFAIKLKNPVTLADGGRLSGFTDPVQQTTFYGYDKNGERFTIRRDAVSADDIVSSKDSNRTADAVRASLGGNGAENVMQSGRRAEPLVETDAVSDGVLDQSVAQTETGELSQSRRSSKDITKAEAIPVGEALIAIHNLTTENLLYADEIGGLPVPSIGVTKAASPFYAFGNITLLAPKGMVDPATGTPVFDRDAYTSRFPELTYKKVPSKKAEAFYAEMDNLRNVADDGDAFSRNTWEAMTGTGASPSKLLDLFGRYNAPKMEYIKTVLGKSIKVPMRDVRVPFSWATDKAFATAVRPVLQSLNDMGTSMVEQSAEFKQLTDMARKQMDRYISKPNSDGARLVAALGRDEALQNLATTWGSDGAWASDTSKTPSWKLVERINQSIRDGGKKEVDSVKLTDQIRKLVPRNDPAYMAWAKSKTAGLFDQPTITVRGKQVSPTLDNIVASMTAGGVAGAEDTMTSGTGKVSAMLGKRFKSLDEIKAARSQVVSTKQEGQAKSATEDTLSKYRDKALEFFTERNYRGDIDTWSGLDASMEALAVAGKGALTDGNVRVALQRKGFKGVDQETIDLAKQGVEALRSAVTDYFEAKPQRAVALSEFRGAVVPKGADPKALEVLTKNNIETVEFNPKKAGDREAKLQKLAKKLDKAEGDIMFSRRAVTPLGFYSALADGVEQINARALPVVGWKDAIKGLINKGQVKADEVEWAGLNDWLDLQTGKVTKEAVQVYLDANGVQVEEVALGGAPKKPWAYQDGITGRFEWFATKQEAEDFLQRQIDEARENAKAIGEDPMDDDEVGVIVNYKDVDENNQDNPTKYASYQLPGGENYREVLLTLPVRGGVKYTEDNVLPITEQDDPAVNKPELFWYFRVPGNVMQIPKSKHPTEAAAKAYIIRDKQPEAPADKNFQSAHWDQPNVVAHIRVNDRTDADGNRVLFVEEIQSDWGQEGKKKGFKKDKPDTVGFTAKKTALGWLIFDGTGAPIGNTPRHWRTAEEAIDDYAEIESNDGIPSAPFVTKTEGWLNLALKRVMVMAAEGGYDKVAFVNGEQSADRYDLSKQVSRLAYDSDGTLEVFDMNGDNMMTRKASEDELPDLIGKEAAQRLIDAPRTPGGRRSLAGDGLKVGGEGMKTFYDKIVPQAVNKLLPKLGGGKVGVVDMPRSGEPGVLKQKGKPWSADMLRQQPGFTITPAMREAVSEGMPMFSRRAQTDTPAFRKWFGDSKVVDANGEPLVVYHGTPKQFTEFKLQENSPRPGSNFGFYFTSNRALAEKYGTPMQVYLSIKNPKVVSIDEIQAMQGKLGGDRDQRWAVEGGYDGARTADGTVWIAFQSTQIKSATDNQGTFDPKNPDIRRSTRASPAAAANKELAQIFTDLQEARGLKLVRANERAAEHPMASQIEYVNANFYDILEQLDDAGLVKINCKK